jgi:hypothetical protein
LQISQGYIIRILQHFATKLWNITNFVMLFHAVMEFCLDLLRSKFWFNFTNSVNISDTGCWEIIINNQIHSLEVDTTAHEFCTYQNPDLKEDKSFVRNNYNVQRSQIAKIQNQTLRSESMMQLYLSSTETFDDVVSLLNEQIQLFQQVGLYYRTADVGQPAVIRMRK